MHPSATLMRLDLETRPYHPAADASWRALLVDDVSEEDYAAQLARACGFEGPIEAALAYTPGLRSVMNVRRRQRSGLVAEDLLALGLEPAEIARLPVLSIAPFATPRQALGWLYVVERMTVVHAIVREHLLAYLPHASRALTYLSAHEASLGSRWLDLAAALERVAPNEVALDEVVVAALAGFRCAIDWYAGEQSMPARRVG